MKRKYLVIAVILSLVLLLSGCDAILEVFYPEFGEQEGGETFNVEVRVTFPGNSAEWTLNHDDIVYIQLWFSEDPDPATPFREHFTDNESDFWWQFFDLPAGDYWFNIFWDYDGSGGVTPTAWDNFYETPDPWYFYVGPENPYAYIETSDPLEWELF